jgi:hypothetical protein
VRSSVTCRIRLRQVSALFRKSIADAIMKISAVLLMERKASAWCAGTFHKKAKLKSLVKSSLLLLVTVEDWPVLVIETRYPHEALRCRRAQYSGYPAEVTVNGSRVLGIVRSVKEETGPLWIVTIVPTTPKVFRRARPSCQFASERTKGGFGAREIRN